jgi:hypothetical protein
MGSRDSDWSLLPEAIEFIVAELAARDASRIVECGSGVSTIAIARFLRARGDGTLHSLEHDAGWAARTRRSLDAEGLAGQANVIDAPLREDPMAPPGYRWYSRDALARLPRRGVELLLVDGPPASPEQGLGRSRYPALPLLRDRLAPGALVILDDADRDGERWVIERWREELAVSLRPRGARIAAGVVEG